MHATELFRSYILFFLNWSRDDSLGNTLLVISFSAGAYGRLFA